MSSKVMWGYCVGIHHGIKLTQTCGQKAINRGGDFKVRVKRTKVCSNHFSAGYYNPDCPVPTLFMRGYDVPCRTRKAPTQRQDIPCPKKRMRKIQTPINEGISDNLEEEEEETEPNEITNVNLIDHEYSTKEKEIGSSRTRTFDMCQNYTANFLATRLYLCKRFNF